MKLVVVQTDNSYSIIEAFAKADGTYEDSKIKNGVGGYIQGMYELSPADTEQEIVDKLQASHVKHPLIQKLYEELKFDLTATDLIQTDAKLVAFLIHGCFRHFDFKKPQEIINIFRVIEDFFQNLANSQFDPVLFKNSHATNPEWVSLSFIRHKITQLAFDISLVISENARQELDALKDKMQRESTQSQNEDSHRYLDQLRQNSNVYQPRTFKQQIVSISPPETPSEKISKGYESICESTVLTQESKKTIRAVLGTRFPCDSEAYQKEAYSIRDLCRNLKTLIKFLNHCYEQYVIQAQRLGNNGKSMKVWIDNWDLYWNAEYILDSEPNKINVRFRDLINDNLTSAKNPLLKPEIYDKRAVAALLIDKAIIYLNTVLVEMELPYDPKPTDFIFYVYGCRSIFGQLLSQICPENDPLIAKHTFISSISKLKADLSQWPFIESAGQFQSTLNAMSSDYIGVALQHTEGKIGVPLPEKKNIFDNAVADIQKLQGSFSTKELRYFSFSTD